MTPICAVRTRTCARGALLAQKSFRTNTHRRARARERWVLSGPKGIGPDWPGRVFGVHKGAIRTLRAGVHARARVNYQKRSNINDLL